MSFFFLEVSQRSTTKDSYVVDVGLRTKGMLVGDSSSWYCGAVLQAYGIHIWPKFAAGWTRSRNPYWATPESFAIRQAKKVIFLLPDLRTFPFAFPEFSEEDDNGFQIVTHPVENTEGMFPHLDDNFASHKVEKAKPSAMQPANLGTNEAEEQTRTNTRPTGKRPAGKEPRDGSTYKRGCK
jgi:hypothetical protein